METLYIKSTLNSPEVNFNPDRCTFSISGQSIMMNVREFYAPVIGILEELTSSPPDKLDFEFNLNYYNLASAKRFMFIIYLLSKLRRKGSKVRITWRYLEEDEFMREFGEDLAGGFKLPLNILPSEHHLPSVRMAC